MGERTGKLGERIPNSVMERGTHRKLIGILQALAFAPGLPALAEEPRVILYSDVDFRGDRVEVREDLTRIDPFLDYYRPVSSIDVLRDEWVILHSAQAFSGNQLRIKGPLSIRNLGQVAKPIGPCFLGPFRLSLSWSESVNSLSFPGEKYNPPDSCGTSCTVLNGCGRVFK